jgi:hypothetical protein
MSMEIRKAEQLDPSKLTPDELMLLQRLQKLAAEGCEEIDEETTAMAKRVLKWSWDDPASIERAAYFSGFDPFLRRESDAISKEFAVADNDGLEDF